MAVYTDKILACFEKLNTIPRCSGNEARVGQWLQQWADRLGFDRQSDSVGNLVVRVPASKGHENSPSLILQGHMDMVCEKTPDSKHDFTMDPIISHLEQEWVTANDTTLGADNGIAIAYMMVLAEDQTIAHPPLELLFTVDEETGLNGAKSLEDDFVKGKMLINLDSEDEGIFTIGCAGGIDTTLTREMNIAPVDGACRLYQLVVGGLKGGHSGIDIDKQRANANKILARALKQIRKLADLRVVALDGGTRHNAIPRDAAATVLIPISAAGAARRAVRQLAAVVQTEYAVDDPQLYITLSEFESPEVIDHALTLSHTDLVIQLLLALPNGVAAMSSHLAGLVETSSNLATVKLEKNQLKIKVSQRSAVVSRLEEITSGIHAVAALAGAKIRDANDYPPWPADAESCLLNKSKTVYRNLFGKQPIIQVIHAGLECAIIGNIYDGMDMISFGPTIENAHSPDERLLVPSVAQVWDFLVALLDELNT
jgi:dipeptidase D